VLLAALYRAGFEAVAHGPVAQDILRDAGEAAVERALAWIVDRSPEALEPTVSRVGKTAAFNMSVLCQILGTPLQPDLDQHVLMLEEVGEAMYRIDRSLFHITSNAGIRRVSGVMLGRCSGVAPNEPDFGMNEEEIARYWCQKSGIPWLGRADIGHDVNNKIVPFGATVAPEGELSLDNGNDRVVRCSTSAVGTNLPIRNVRYTAALGGNPDIERTSPKGRV
jgi:muramoyltetrapeptide carboxypeptidase